MSLKERMSGFFEDLAFSSKTRTEVSASTHTAARFFQIAIPALVMGIGVGISDAAVTHEQNNSFHVNQVQYAPMLSMDQLARNHEEALSKYAVVNAQNDMHQLIACEYVFGDTFDSHSRDSAVYIEKVLNEASFEKQEDYHFFYQAYCVYGKNALSRMISEQQSGNASTFTPAKAAPVEQLLLETGYQQLMLSNNSEFTTGRSMNDDGVVFNNPMEALTHQVRSSNAADWAGAIFGIAEGVARITGNNDVAEQASGAAKVTGRANNYYKRGQRASKQSGGRSAQSFGRIVKDMGREVQRSQNRNSRRNSSRY